MKLNLGCGKRKLKDHINSDIRKEMKPDIVFDCEKPFPFKDNSFTDIMAMDLIEHLSREGVLTLMDEAHRCLTAGGLFYHRTPSSEGRGAWQDPTHKSAWNINTWKYYFVDPAYRDLYGTKAHFKIRQLFDEWADKENKVLHTHCLYEAVK